MRAAILLVLIGAAWAGGAGATGRADTTLRTPRVTSGVTRHVDEYWPNGNVRRSVDYLGDVRHGEYRTWSIDGRPYEFKHFVDGREDGLQQAWDPDGKLYLNYVVKNGRRYGMVNAKPCLPAAADGTSQR
jgi:hypothetical protein